MNKISAMVILLLLIAPVLPAKEASAPPPCRRPQEVVEDEVGAIISDYERNAFVSLKNDRDRDKFIELSWEDRDPPPHQRNEFRRRVPFAARLREPEISATRAASLPGRPTGAGSG